MKPTLYSYWRSTCSWRVRIALNIKGIEHDLVPVNILQGDQNSDDYYQTVSSMPLLPTLNIDGQNLCQSIAILEYLEETRPEPALLPKHPLCRAKVREIVGIICSDIQPLQNLRVLQSVGEDKKMEHAKHFITAGFESLEALLAKCSGKYCFGDLLTLADVCLVPQVYNARRFGVDMSKFPIISKIEQGLAEHPAFVKADPGVQPDAPSS